MPDPTPNPYPLNISEKQDAWEKSQLLANIDPSFKYLATEFNKIIQALNWLYENIGGGPGIGTPKWENKYFGAGAFINTAGASTTSIEWEDHVNAVGFTISIGELVIIQIFVKRQISGISHMVRERYLFKKNNVLGTWGTGSTNGEIEFSDFIRIDQDNVSEVSGDNEVIELGDIGEVPIHTYINGVDPATVDWESLSDGTTYYFDTIYQGSQQIYEYKGVLPITLGDGNTAVDALDFDLLFTDQGSDSTDIVIPKEEKIKGSIIELQAVSGNIELNYNLYCLFIIELSGSAQFINIGLPNNNETIVRNMLVTGGSFTPGDGWIESPNSDTYDASKWNSFTLNIYNSLVLGVQVRYSIENLESVSPSVDVVAELGQSNIEGRHGDTGNPSYPFTSSNGIYWNGSTGEDISTDRGGAVDGSHANYFAEEYFALTGRKAVMVEAAQGGTGLTSTASATNWSNGSTLRSSAETLINGALTAYSKALPKAALWCQGERDAQEMDSNGSYTKPIVKAAMQDVIDWWQTTYPGVPFIISELGDTNTGANTQGWQDMRDIQNEIVAENDNVYIGFSNAKNFHSESKMNDSLHYNYTGYQEMGEALATFLSNL